MSVDEQGQRVQPASPDEQDHRDQQLTEGSSAALSIDFVGEWYEVMPDQVFTIGREGDLEIDDNPYLHRRFMEIRQIDGLWWLSNVGTMISATVADSSGGMQAWVSPGSRIPLVFGQLNVVFTAGPTTYEFSAHLKSPSFMQQSNGNDAVGETTIGPVIFTPAQKALIVALAEPILRRGGTGFSTVPSSANAAKRLGWPLTRFNRKLDNVCDKLDRVGVAGLRGGGGKLATNRRARLVEHAVTSHLVTPDDLPLLDQSLGDED
ncbi:hypothetical protein GCM10010977_04020 [Citricoccus zhacaiensis]|uniref:Uncharacterized protein n=2 Tax=Citricoccus zhacaiensis TaxID=489142 RepID=A0ABQ2LNH5_9MICC|nr:hypothetical protein GCM10010977_04020 [Citricoccus zhacaiensis]